MTSPAPFTKPSALHIDPIEGVNKAQTLFNDVQQGQKILHFVSDFRDLDWSGPGGEELNKAVEKLVESGIHLSLIDTAHPYRGTNAASGPASRQPGHHRSCTPRRASSPRASRPSSASRSAISAPATRRPSCTSRWTARKSFAGSRPIDRIPADGSVTEKFTLIFAKKKPSLPVGAADLPEDRERKRRLDQEFVQSRRRSSRRKPACKRTMSATWSWRFASVCRRSSWTAAVRIPTSTAATFNHLQAAYEAARSYEIERCKVDDLDKINLDLYPTVIFLNVSEIKSDKTLQESAGVRSARRQPVLLPRRQGSADLLQRHAVQEVQRPVSRADRQQTV